MKSIIIWAAAMIFAIPSFAQCTTAQAEATPLTWVQFNSFKYIGTNGKENKANTEAMYKKMAQIFELFANAFKNSKGFTGRWKAQVDVLKGWDHFQLPDFERVERQYPITWVVVKRPTPPGLVCQYENEILDVCRLPALQ